MPSTSQMTDPSGGLAAQHLMPMLTEPAFRFSGLSILSVLVNRHYSLHGQELQ